MLSVPGPSPRYPGSVEPMTTHQEAAELMAIAPRTLQRATAARDPVREASQRVPAAPMTRIRPAIACVAAADVAAVGHRSLRCRAIPARRLTTMAIPSR